MYWFVVCTYNARYCCNIHLTKLLQVCYYIIINRAKPGWGVCYTCVRENVNNTNTA